MTAVFAHQFALLENVNRYWRLNADAGASPDSFLEAKAWANVASKLTIGDVIEVFPCDGSFYMRLLVRDAGTTWAKVAKLEFVDFEARIGEAVEPSEMDNYEVRWGGPAAKFRVHRKADNAIVSETGFVDRESAAVWIAEYVKTLAK